MDEPGSPMTPSAMRDPQPNWTERLLVAGLIAVTLALAAAMIAQSIKVFG